MKYKQDYLEQKDNKMKTKFKLSAKRIGLDLKNKNMLKHRKQGGGAKRALDNDIETAIANAIEEKCATAHGRLHDLVLYCKRRVKARDLLGIANYYLNPSLYGGGGGGDLPPGSFLLQFRNGWL